MNIWSKEEVDFLKKSYKNTYSIILSKKLNRTAVSIGLKARSLGLSSQLKGKPLVHCSKKTFYTFHESFFNKPNILNSYWAGFIAADGGIINSGKNRKLVLVIDLATKDKEHLEKFKKDIKFNGKIYSYKNFNRIAIRSNNLINDLNKNFNITPRKSLTLKPPNKLNKKQTLAFIIGYIDGDGCIFSKTQPKYDTTSCTILLVGTKTFLKWVCNNFNRTNKVSKIKNNKAFQVCFSNKKDNLLVNLYKFTIKNKLPVLNRKWNKIYEMYK